MGSKERMNPVGIERGNAERAVKDSRGEILSEFFYNNDKDGISKLTKIALGYGNCEAVVKSTVF